MNLVVDASVAAKWLFLEGDSEKAWRLLESAQAGDLQLLAPQILPAEIANAMWKRIRRGDLDRGLALTLFDAFGAMRFRFFPVPDLIVPALKLAIHHQHPVYDCLYLALAIATPCELVTADVRLYSTLSPSYPQVRLLRDWRP